MFFFGLLPTGSHLTNPLRGDRSYQQPAFELPLSVAGCSCAFVVTKGNSQTHVGRPSTWTSASSRKTSWNTRKNWGPIIKTCSANSPQSWMSRWDSPWVGSSCPFIESAHLLPNARRTGKSLFSCCRNHCTLHEHHAADLSSPLCAALPQGKDQGREKAGEKRWGPRYFPQFSEAFFQTIWAVGFLGHTDPIRHQETLGSAPSRVYYHSLHPWFRSSPRPPPPPRLWGGVT